MNATLKTEWITLRVSDGTKMRAFVSKPVVTETQENSKLKPLIILQEAFGVNSHIQSVCKRFSDAGFLAIAPELFHRTAPEGEGFVIPYDKFEETASHVNALKDEKIKVDLHAVQNYLHSLSDVDLNWLGTVGFSLGGRISFFANAVLPLNAAVSFYGSKIVPTLLPEVTEQKGPLLLIWAGQDKNITIEEKRVLRESLYKNEKNFVHVEFSKADHGFFCNERKSYNEKAAEQAFALTVAFIKSYI